MLTMFTNLNNMLMNEYLNGGYKMNLNCRFVMKSIETHLFFARIMKEHALFLQLGFTPRDSNYTQRANKIRMEFDRFLWDVINISNGKISENVVESEEIVTPFTLRAENKTSFYTGINIPTEITRAELELESGECRRFDSRTEQAVRRLNERAICLIEEIIDFKTEILDNVIECKMFTMNYPLLIDHILREARLYLRTIRSLQEGEGIDLEKEMYEQELFWNRIMAEHSKFIRGLLDPTEDDLINAANDFAIEFDELAERVLEAMKNSLPLDEITEDSLEETREVKQFNTAGTEGILECKIQSIILPLLGDHVLRESNHFIRLLKKFQQYDYNRPSSY